MADSERRNLKWALGVLGAIGCLAVVWAAATSFMPPEHVLLARTKEIDIGKLQPGEVLQTEWEGLHVFVLRRTEHQIEWLKNYTAPSLEKRMTDDLPSNVLKNQFRSVTPQFLVFALWKNGQNWMLQENETLVYPCEEFLYSKNEIVISSNVRFPGGFYCAKMHGNRIVDLAKSAFVYDPAGRTAISWVMPLSIPPHRIEGDKLVLQPKI